MSRLTPHTKNKCANCGKEIRSTLSSWLFPKSRRCICKSRGAVVAERMRDATVLKEAESPEMDDLSGQVINGRYEVLSLLGSGGMAAVYRVVDRPTGKEYALKMLASHLSDQHMLVKRLELEAEAIRSLTHSNICALYDVGKSESGFPYIIMDYVKGQSLESMLKLNRTIAQSRAINIFVQTAQALEHAHQKCVVHRDLKPSNILLTQNADGVDRVIVVDFGIAKIADESTENSTKLTQTGELIGSPLYMSPEQCRGDQLDGRSDIYSLGCLMYELLSGITPFAGETPIRIILKHLTEPPPRLDKISGVSREMAEVVDRCLEKDPGDRYQSASKLLVDLINVREGRRISPLRRKKTKASPTLILTAAMSIIILLSTAGLVLQKSFTHRQMKIDLSPLSIPMTPWDQLEIDAQIKFNQGAYEQAELAFDRALKVSGITTDQTLKTLQKQLLLNHVVGYLHKQASIKNRIDEIQSKLDIDARSAETLKSELIGLSAVPEELKKKYAVPLGEKIILLCHRLLSKQSQQTELVEELVSQSLPVMEKILGADSYICYKLIGVSAAAIDCESEALQTTRELSEENPILTKSRMESLRLTKISIGGLENKTDAKDFDLNANYARMAHLLNALNDPGRSLAYSQRALGNLKTAGRQDSILKAGALIESAKSYQLKHEFEEALKQYQLALVALNGLNDFVSEPYVEQSVEGLFKLFASAGKEKDAELLFKRSLASVKDRPLTRAVYDMAIANLLFPASGSSHLAPENGQAYLREALLLRQHFEQSPFTEEVLESSRRVSQLDVKICQKVKEPELAAEAESLARQAVEIVKHAHGGEVSRRLALAYADLSEALKVNGKVSESEMFQQKAAGQLAYTEGYLLEERAAKLAKQGNDPNLEYARAELDRGASCYGRGDLINAEKFAEKAAGLVLEFQPNQLGDAGRKQAAKILDICSVFQSKESEKWRHYRDLSAKYRYFSADVK